MWQAVLLPMTGTLVNGNVKPCIIHLRNPKINANVMLEGAHLVESAGPHLSPWLRTGVEGWVK